MPTHPVLYWRDNATRTALTAFDTLDKLIAAKPLQVLEFDTTVNQIEKLIRGYCTCVLKARNAFFEGSSGESKTITEHSSVFSGWCVRLFLQKL